MPALPPYAQLLGLSVTRSETGELVWTMPFRNEAVGRPGFLHGGAIAGLLEFAVIGTLKDALGDDAVEIKPINVTCHYLRGGIDHDTFAAATLTRLGRRVANVEAHAWQSDREKPIATAQMNLLLKQ